VVLVTEWSEYRTLNWAEIIKSPNNPSIVNGRNFLQREGLEKLGYRYVGVGR
jgi:UDPglucose 6-dehydrogenase